MIVKLAVAGVEHKVDSADLTPWLFGLAANVGGLDLDIRNGRGELEPVTVTRLALPPKADSYEITIGNARRLHLPAQWALAWTAGLAARHREQLNVNRSASARAASLQALMICHQRGWITYHGPTPKREGEQ
jgi:hypothetical protein